jgi:polygalacturonase
MKKFLLFLLPIMGVFAASVAAFGASPTIGLYGMSQWFANNVARSGSAAEARTSLGINSGAEVDVKSDYGAVGDGVADDSTPFVNALAGVTDGGMINVPAGTYLVNTNVLYLEGKSVRIRGVPGKSIIKNPNATTSFGTIGFSTWGRFGATSTLLSVPVYQNRQTRTIPVVSSSGFSVGQSS